MATAMAIMIIGNIITVILAAVAVFVLPFVFLFSFFSSEASP
jgi:hypothetical protein